MAVIGDWWRVFDRIVYKHVCKLCHDDMMLHDFRIENVVKLKRFKSNLHVQILKISSTDSKPRIALPVNGIDLTEKNSMLYIRQYLFRETFIEVLIDCSNNFWNNFWPAPCGTM